jgi:hypothetical protein
MKHHSVILFKFPFEEKKTKFLPPILLPHSKHIPILAEEHLIAIPVFIVDRWLKRHSIPVPTAPQKLIDCLIYIA